MYKWKSNKQQEVLQTREKKNVFSSFWKANREGADLNSEGGDFQSQGANKEKALSLVALEMAHTAHSLLDTPQFQSV